MLLKHRDTLTPLPPQSPAMRALAQRVEDRRRLVGDKVRHNNRLTSALKNSFPHVLQWFEEKDTDTVVNDVGIANRRRRWCNSSVVCSLPAARDSRIMSRAIRPSNRTLQRTRDTLFCIFR